jgi:transcriptional regulator with XRE-family HTH domain
MRRDLWLTARALLGWSQEQLADAAGVPLSAVYTLERIGSADEEYKRRVQMALESAGVVFTDGDEPGVKLKRAEP